MNADICRVDIPESPPNGTGISEVETHSPQSPLLNCPQPGDPPEFSYCCYFEAVSNVTNDDFFNQNTNPHCCPESEQRMLFNFISDRLALLIAVTITAVLLLVTIVIVVCCFWSRCPLYMMCRIRYRQEDIIAYASKDDETTNLNDMPPEEQKGVTVYSPNAVKVTPKEDV
ncbi:hypothetical protein Avbf_00373 [Armadillidium vulgare]|nr:hypothetical protein Avbf_00373 [Armadillidium vulgare]